MTVPAASVFLASGRFADGQVLDVYESNDATRQPAQAAAVDPVTMTSAGVTITGLEYDTAYVAGNVIGGRWIGVAVRTMPYTIPDIYVVSAGQLRTSSSLTVDGDLAVAGSVEAGSLAVDGDSVLSGALSVKEQVNVVPTSLSDQNVVLKAGGFAAGFGNGPAVTFTKADAGGSTTNDMSVSRVYDSVNGDHLLVDSPAVFQGALTAEDTVALQGNFLGFYNATPAVKPTVTGSRGANAALASLLTKLAALGLITDSTS